ncbi:MAG: bifunctional precorrin-2 dehydrogenase/sirohydrochlorin ferrochelatase [Acidobacteriota bacterium]|nr:bifunctional precorrin-2 dehydrogenase/sirohydrochlorin ferrochelatase [Acidobacteriota bacterium]
MHLYPAFLKLDGRRVVVVGAGPVAASKLRGLLDAGADVTVVAPAWVAEAEAEAANVTQVEREFRPSDLDGAWLVVAAATPAVNREVALAAEARRVFVNAVDDPPNASLYLGGVVRRAGVTFAISTDGRAPALAGLLREGIDAVLPVEELDRWLPEAVRMRERWRDGQVPMEARRPELLEALVRLYSRDSNDDCKASDAVTPETSTS